MIVGFAASVLVLMGLPAHGQEDAATKFSEKFADFDLNGQAQVATACAFMGAVECNRPVGAQVQVTKPSTVFALASVFQRGLATSYTFGSTIGGGEGSGSGGKGIIPTFPGEAVGLFPSEPREGRWEGAVTSAAGGAVVDGRARAKATEVPSGSATFELQHVDVAEHLTAEDAVVYSQGGPVEQGVEVEAVSVLKNLVVGGVLKISSLTSRAYGLIPAAVGDPQGVGFTAIEGASINDTPVLISDKGITVAEQTQGEGAKDDAQAQLRQALAAASIQDIRLTQATVEPGEQGRSIQVRSGLLQVVYNNREFGAANPQGVSGGSIEVGGASVEVSARRADDVAAPSASAGAEPISDPFAGSPEPTPAADAGATHPSPGGRDAEGTPGSDSSDPFPSTGLSPMGDTIGRASNAAYPVDTYPSSFALSSGATSGLANLSAPDGSSPDSRISGSTVAVSGTTRLPAATNGVLRAISAETVRSSGTPGGDQWMETIYLGLIAVPLLLVVAFRLSVVR